MVVREEGLVLALAAAGQDERRGGCKKHCELCAHIPLTPSERDRISGQRVFGAAAALRWRQPAALGRDRAALHTVGGTDVDTAVPCLIDLRRTQPLPEVREVSRDLTLDHDVVRLIVPRLVAGREDRG